MEEEGAKEEEDKGSGEERTQRLGSTSLHDITVGCLLTIIIDRQTLLTEEVETFDPKTTRHPR